MLGILASNHIQASQYPGLMTKRLLAEMYDTVLYAGGTLFVFAPLHILQSTASLISG